MNGNKDTTAPDGNKNEVLIMESVEDEDIDIW